MPVYDDLTDLALEGWPQNLVGVDKSVFRVLVTTSSERIGSLPRDWNAYRNDVLIGRDDGSGPAPAGDSDSAYAHFRNLKVAGAMSYSVTITSSTSLTMNAHNGCDVFVNSSAAVALTLAPSGDPDAGILDGFTCVVRRQGSGEVSLTIDSSYDNQHPDGYTKVSRQGLAITIKLKGTGLFLDGNLGA